MINKALFGSYPTCDSVKELEKNGVRFFVDLTFKDETKIIPYNTDYTYIHYPIKDNKVPTNWRTFSVLILKLKYIIKNLNKGEKIYIHCKGGHGRSGILVACLLCAFYNIKPSNAITATTKFHNKRVDMKEKWRKIGSPQTRSQKRFVSKFFQRLYIYSTYSNYFTYGFSNLSPIPVIIDSKKYICSKDAIDSKDVIDSKKYIDIDKDVIDSKDVINSIDKDNYSFLFYITEQKFNQNISLKERLISTGLRPIFFYNKTNYVMCNVLSKLREKFYFEIDEQEV